MDALINVNGENFQTLQILLLTTLITLLPSIVVMMTSFTRYIISLSLYYRVVVIRAPLQGLCYTIRDAVDWLRSPTA